MFVCTCACVRARAWGGEGSGYFACSGSRFACPRAPLPACCTFLLLLDACVVAHACATHVCARCERARKTTLLTLLALAAGLLHDGLAGGAHAVCIVRPHLVHLRACACLRGRVGVSTGEALECDRCCCCCCCCYCCYYLQLLLLLLLLLLPAAAAAAAPACMQVCSACTRANASMHACTHARTHLGLGRPVALPPPLLLHGRHAHAHAHAHAEVHHLLHVLVHLLEGVARATEHPHALEHGCHCCLRLQLRLRARACVCVRVCPCGAMKANAS